MRRENALFRHQMCSSCQAANSVFLQRVSVACYAERCTSYSKSVRPSVCPSVRHTLALCMSKRLQLWSCGLRGRI